jgi:hypothetical protein
MALNGWIEVGLSNPNIFASQSNTDVVIRSFDPSFSNKIIIGNTSSNEGPNRLGGLYVHNNNVGFKKVPLSGVDVDINGLYSTIDGRVASNLTVGYGSNAGFLQLRGDMLVINNNTSDMRAINSNNTFRFMYSNVERIRFTNGSGMYLNDNVYITNDVYATGFYMTSDSNFKENINDSIQDTDLNSLMKLKVYDFNLKGQSKTVKGFIAQQVESVLPSAINEIDSIIPCIKGDVDVDLVRDHRIVVVNASYSNINLEDVLKQGDEVVIGRNASTKEMFCVVQQVGNQWFEVSPETAKQLVHLDNYPHLYLHGKSGKMKTIDTNQILALCVSSIQQLAHQYKCNNKD